MKLKKINICIIIFLLIVGMQTNIYGKYVIQNSFEIATVSTDETKPVISILEFINSNAIREYANNTHTITVRIKVVEKNITVNKLNEKVKVLVGGIEEKNKIEEITRTGGSSKMSIFSIKISNLTGNGKLELQIEDGAIVDIGGNKNDEVTISPGITIDNIAPSVTFEEVVLEDGKVQANLISNEKLRTKDGWAFSEDLKILSKEFPSNISYPVEVYDHAENLTTINISITKATYITLNYGSYNPDFGWDFNSSESIIAGNEAIMQNPLHKTEMLAFRTEGNIDNDFLQIQAYVHTYWGENAKVMSNSYETFFYHGYNPGIDMYNTMSDGELVFINKIKHFIFGGDGLNRTGKTSINVKNQPIPEEVAKQYLFGVSGIKAKLKDDTNYSVIYQIFVDGQGWQKASCDGEESTYAHDKPITGYKMAIVPQSEKEEIMEYWNEDMQFIK